jgi:hypothetical protein
MTNADNVKIFHRSTHTIKKKKEALLGSGKEIGVDVNAEKTNRLMFLEQHENR